MNTWIEFLGKTGAEGIGPTHLHNDKWKQYDGPIPNTGDVVVGDFDQRFLVMDRLFYFMPNDPNIKESLHCEKLPWKS